MKRNWRTQTRTWRWLKWNQCLQSVSIDKVKTKKTNKWSRWWILWVLQHKTECILITRLCLHHTPVQVQHHLDHLDHQVLLPSALLSMFNLITRLCLHRAPVHVQHHLWRPRCRQVALHTNLLDSGWLKSFGRNTFQSWNFSWIFSIALAMLF